MARSVLTLLERIRSTSAEAQDADWLARGVAAREKQQYLKALEAWRRASAQGDAEADYRIGLLYARGEGVVQSLPDAVSWYRRAAEAGHADAQYQLGLIYLNGANSAAGGLDHWFEVASQQNSEAAQQTLNMLFPNGIAVEKDLDQARHWIWAAAAAGKVEAQAVLGEIYRRGLGITQDYQEAHRWYWLAAQQGIASAQFAMGDLHYQGLGVAVNHQLAAEWYEKAANNGDARAQVAVGSMYRTGQGRPVDPKKAGQLFVQAAERGEVRGLYYAGLMHLKGEGLAESIEKAETYLRRSAKQSYLPAITSLAQFYAHGNGIEPDLREAAVWYLKAAELGDVQSQFIVGRLYATGSGVPNNLRDSAKWFLRAAEQGHPTAAHNIATYFAKGTGVDHDPAKALEWYQAAAAAGITASQVQLGKIYSAGDGVPCDRKLAAEWLEKAAQSGDSEAKTALAILQLQNEGAVQDPSRAEELLKEAAEGGHPVAALQLGHLYSGKYSAKSGEAVRWYTKAAEAGAAEAQYALGMLYLNGRNVQKDARAAASWIEKAAHSGHAPSQFQLAVLYCTNQGVPQDLAQAVSWYEQAAERGHPLAQYNLAVMLSKGQGCQADEARAATWFRKAAEQNVAEAKRALADRYRAERSQTPADDTVRGAANQNASVATAPLSSNQQETGPAITPPSPLPVEQGSHETPTRPSAVGRSEPASSGSVSHKTIPVDDGGGSIVGTALPQASQDGADRSASKTDLDLDHDQSGVDGSREDIMQPREPRASFEASSCGTSVSPAASPKVASAAVQSSQAKVLPESTACRYQSPVGFGPTSRPTSKVNQMAQAAPRNADHPEAAQGVASRGVDSEPSESSPTVPPQGQAKDTSLERRGSFEPRRLSYSDVKCDAPRDMTHSRIQSGARPVFRKPDTSTLAATSDFDAASQQPPTQPSMDRGAVTTKSTLRTNPTPARSSKLPVVESIGDAVTPGSGRRFPSTKIDSRDRGISADQRLQAPAQKPGSTMSRSMVTYGSSVTRERIEPSDRALDTRRGEPVRPVAAEGTLEDCLRALSERGRQPGISQSSQRLPMELSRPDQAAEIPIASEPAGAKTPRPVTSRGRPTLGTGSVYSEVSGSIQSERLELEANDPRVRAIARPPDSAPSARLMANRSQKNAGEQQRKLDQCAPCARSPAPPPATDGSARSDMSLAGVNAALRNVRRVMAQLGIHSQGPHVSAKAHPRQQPSAREFTPQAAPSASTSGHSRGTLGESRTRHPRPIGAVIPPPSRSRVAPEQAPAGTGPSGSSYNTDQVKSRGVALSNTQRSSSRAIPTEPLQVTGALGVDPVPAYNVKDEPLIPEIAQEALISDMKRALGRAMIDNHTRSDLDNPPTEEPTSRTKARSNSRQSTEQPMSGSAVDRFLTDVTRQLDEIQFPSRGRRNRNSETTGE